MIKNKPGRKASGELTPKLRRLVDVFLTEGNRQYSLTGRLCGYKGSAAQICENVKTALNRPEAKEYMDATLEELAKEVKATQERTIREYCRIGYLDPRKFFDSEGNLKQIHAMGDDEAAAISDIEFREIFEEKGRSRVHVGRIHKIKFASKVNALDSLARHLGLFAKDKVAITGENGGPIHFIVKRLGATKTDA